MPIFREVYFWANGGAEKEMDRQKCGRVLVYYFPHLVSAGTSSY
jgi:hypothetical protein